MSFLFLGQPSSGSGFRELQQDRRILTSLRKSIARLLAAQDVLPSRVLWPPIKKNVGGFGIDIYDVESMFSVVHLEVGFL